MRFPNAGLPDDAGMVVDEGSAGGGRLLPLVRRVGLSRLEPVHVAAYVESLGKTHAAPSVEQQLAAVRMLFD